jgi:hypothetical protein
MSLHEAELEGRVDELYEKCERLERELAAAKAKSEALRALIRMDDVEWRDKHIHPCGGEAYQNWLVQVYLPVPLSAPDKSPEAALERALTKKNAS